jgi:hypothetical protein
VIDEAYNGYKRIWEPLDDLEVSDIYFEEEIVEEEEND